MSRVWLFATTEEGGVWQDLLLAPDEVDDVYLSAMFAGDRGTIQLPDGSLKLIFALAFADEGFPVNIRRDSILDPICPGGKLEPHRLELVKEAAKRRREHAEG